MFLDPLLDVPHRDFRLINRRSGEVLAERLATAFDSSSRRKGLLGTDGLTRGSALIIAPTNAIHTWFMRFAIDVAFVAKDGRIVKARRGLRPWRVFAAWKAFAAIELPAGTLDSTHTVEGDTVILEGVRS